MHCIVDTSLFWLLLFEHVYSAYSVGDLFQHRPSCSCLGRNFVLLPSISATQLHRSRHFQRINILDNDFTISTLHGFRRMHGFNELWRKGISLHCIYRPYCSGHKLQKFILGIISLGYTRVAWRIVIQEDSTFV
jgi:hypothetical protein